MNRITPLRLIGVALALAALGGVCILATFSLHGGAVFAAFLVGNALLGLAGLVGFLGMTALAVEIGVRAAQRVSVPSQRPAVLHAEEGSGAVRVAH